MNEKLEREAREYAYMNTHDGDGGIIYIGPGELEDAVSYGYSLALSDIKKEIEERRRLPHGWDSEGEPQYWEEIGMDEGYKHILDFIDELRK